MKTQTQTEIENKGRALLKQCETLEAQIETQKEHAMTFSGDDARREWAKVHELENQQKTAFRELQNNPFVGMQVTVVYASDKRGGVITEISGGKFKVEELEYHHTAPYEGDCTVTDNKTGKVLGWFSPRKCGVCYEVGFAASYHNVHCVLGFARTYIDPHF